NIAPMRPARSWTLSTSGSAGECVHRSERECALLGRRGTLFRGTERLADQKDGSMGAIPETGPATPRRGDARGPFSRRSSIRASEVHTAPRNDATHFQRDIGPGGLVMRLRLTTLLLVLIAGAASAKTLPPTFTVCASGCDFPMIQDAVAA